MFYQKGRKKKEHEMLNCNNVIQIEAFWLKNTQLCCPLLFLWMQNHVDQSKR